MTSYTGVTKVHRDVEGENFPLFNPRYGPTRGKQQWKPVSAFVIRIGETKTAIGTDDYTYTVFVAPRALMVVGCWLVDPVGITQDATNYNTYALMNSAVTMCSKTSARSLYRRWPWEVSLANTEANRTLAAADTVTLVIAGTVAGAVITEDTEIWVLCVPA